MEQENKYQKALGNLKQFNMHSFPVASLHSWFSRQIETLQEIVDKETPMKPSVHGDDIETVMYWKCSKCKSRHLINKYSQRDKYCSCCGQKLDWSDANDE